MSLPKKMQFGKQHSTLRGRPKLPWLASRRAELAIGPIEGMTRRMTQMSVLAHPHVIPSPRRAPSMTG